MLFAFIVLCLPRLAYEIPEGAGQFHWGER